MVKQITEICYQLIHCKPAAASFQNFSNIAHSCQKGPPGSVTQCDSICTEMCKAFEEEWEGDKEA